VEGGTIGSVGKEHPISMLKQLEQRKVLQQAVEKAPCITFGQFRHVAKQRGWLIAWLVEQAKGEIDRPTDTSRP
jgi:hypothetical protein